MADEMKIPESVDNALTNLTDEPTKAIGGTLADIWYLVFGGLGYLAEKRKLRYAVGLEQYQQELQSKIDAIPEEKQIEADIQVVAPALEQSKYCVEKETLRQMFAELIASSMNRDKAADVHPIFTDIISKMSELDAHLFRLIAKKSEEDKEYISKQPLPKIVFSFAILEQLGLISLADDRSEESDTAMPMTYKFTYHFDGDVWNKRLNKWSDYLNDHQYTYIVIPEKRKNQSGKSKDTISFYRNKLRLTSLGEQFKKICL